jgi:PTH1 family peptidyl-tRNA hydrolase
VHLVVGLGNPGKKYERTRHNVGFMVVEHLVRTHGMPDLQEKFTGVWTKGEISVNSSRYPVAVLEPGTFMNRSGDCVQPAAAFLKIEPKDVIVIHDELDLAWRDVRLKLGGGHAGHNGLRSLIDRLGTPDFVRVRVGIGRPPPGFKGDVADFVLQSFDSMEAAELPEVIDRACAAIEAVVSKGAQAAMNALNGPWPRK